MLRQMGARVTETTEAARVSAAAAVARATGYLLSPALGSVTVTATKARLTASQGGPIGIGVNNRVVWIVTAGPLRFRGYGRPAFIHTGQRTLVIDANTGQRLADIQRGVP